MKKLIFNLKASIATLICLLYISPDIIAQSVPQGMKFQAVARDVDGNVRANEAMIVRIELQSNIEEPVIHYAENHRVYSNQLGLINLIIGKGETELGAFENIPWSTDEIWVEIKVKTEDSDGFLTMSKSQLLAVPYAYYAGMAGELSNSAQGGGNGNGNGMVMAMAMAMAMVSDLTGGLMEMIILMML